MATTARKTIGTHSGTFHCDEALACFMLKQTQMFKDADIVRSRDPAVLEKLDVNIDVGGVYDPQRFRFDHHQIGFTDTLDDKHATKLSSAGLVYKHFGREVIQSLVGTSPEHTELLFYKVYNGLIEGIDGIDNGVDRYPRDILPKYKVNTDLSSRVGSLNPWWNDTTTNVDDRFKQAIELAGKEFSELVLYYGKSWLPARTIVEDAVKQRFEVDPSGHIILLSQFCPWKDHLFNIEKEMGIESQVLYCLFQDTNGTWRIQAVPVREDSFASRLPLPWKGLRDEELSKASGIDGGVFVHISGFIGGNKSKEGVLAMARKAIEMSKQQESTDQEAKKQKTSMVE